MRYTNVATTSYVVALILLTVAMAFATWRQCEAPRLDTRDDSWSGERKAYSTECASCHADATTLAGTLASGADWRPLAELLLTGETRVTERGKTRSVRRHPTFETSSDERLAAILNYVHALSGGAARDSRPIPVSSTDLRALRSRRSEAPSSK